MVDFYGKLNIADTEKRQTCVGSNLSILSWATYEEKYYVEEVGDGVFVVSNHKLS